MAKVLNPLASERASGKIVTKIYQAWRGLNVVRRFTMPTIRYTESQMKRRGNFAQLSIGWRDVLSSANRDTWDAMELSIVNLWGQPVKATGLDLYQKINSILLDSGKTLLVDAPLTPALLSPDCAGTFDATVNKIVVVGPTVDEVTDYAPFVDVWIAGLSEFVSTVANVTTIKTNGIRPSQNPGKNGYRHIAFMNENDLANQTINFTDFAGAPLAADIKIAVIIIRYTSDGMKSVPVWVEGETVLHV